jgi:leader peptidase (prepilin peptidase)/N-methyltransferase
MGAGLAVLVGLLYGALGSVVAGLSLHGLRADRLRSGLVSPRGILLGLAGLAFTLAAWYRAAGDLSQLARALLLGLPLLAITGTDLEARLIPNRLTLSGVALGAAVAAAEARLPGACLGAALALGLFGAVYIIGNRLYPGGFGAGDVKLAGLIGLELGFPAGLSALLLGVLIGGAGALVLLGLRARRLKDPIPYGPFLCAGAAVTLLAN